MRSGTRRPLEPGTEVSHRGSTLRAETMPASPTSPIRMAIAGCYRSGATAMKTTFDVIVIGTGQSGPFLAVRMAAAGRRVAILERARFGGTCVNTASRRRHWSLPPSRRTWLVARRISALKLQAPWVST